MVFICEWNFYGYFFLIFSVIPNSLQIPCILESEKNVFTVTEFRMVGCESLFPLDVAKLLTIVALMLAHNFKKSTSNTIIQ